VKNKLKALLFDCDGVLAETEADGHRVAFNNTFASCGIDAFWSVEEYGELLEIGGGKERMTAFFAKYPEKYPPESFNAELIGRLHKLKTAGFMELVPSLSPRPGVRRLMLEAVDNGLQVFICSTSNEQSVTTIAKSILGDEMDRVITHIYAGDVVKAKKPAPDIYLMVSENHGIKPEECMVIEDTRIGLLSATSAGMPCVVTMSEYSKDEDFTEAAAVLTCLGDEATDALPIRGFSREKKQITLADLESLVR